MNLIDRIVQHEGFSETAYPDPLTGAEPYTFGHGLTWLTEEESLWLVNRRIEKYTADVFKAFPFMVARPPGVADVAIEMAYQMGMDGLKSFRKMWAAIEAEDYESAANEMLDSKWHEQTPERAETLAFLMRKQ